MPVCGNCMEMLRKVCHNDAHSNNHPGKHILMQHLMQGPDNCSGVWLQMQLQYPRQQTLPRQLYHPQRLTLFEVIYTLATAFMNPPVMVLKNQCSQSPDVALIAKVITPQ